MICGNVNCMLCFLYLYIGLFRTVSLMHLISTIKLEGYIHCRMSVPQAQERLKVQKVVLPEV